MPVAFTSTRTSPAFGPSSWTSMTVSGLPFSSATAARVFMAASSQPGSVTLHPNDPAFLDFEREPPLLECERLVPEWLPPPTGHGRDIGFIVGGDAVEVVDGGDYLGGNPMPFRGHAQQHLEQLHGSLPVDRRPGAVEPRQRFWVAREPAPDRLDDRFAPFRALEAPGQGAQGREPFGGRGRLDRDVADDVVLEHAPARHVALLRLALAPSGDLDEHGKLLGLAYPRLQAFPGMLRLEAIGGRRGEHLHFLAHPIGACALFQISGELEIDIAQVCDVGDRIDEMRLAERPTRPSGEAMRFVQGVSGDALHELRVRDRIAIAQRHVGDLTVDDR